MFTAEWKSGKRNLRYSRGNKPEKKHRHPLEKKGGDSATNIWSFEDMDWDFQGPQDGDLEDTASYSPADIYRQFGETWCPSIYFSTVKIEAARSSKRRKISEPIRRHILGNITMKTYIWVWTTKDSNHMFMGASYVFQLKSKVVPVLK
jgi:hypothetical protein